MTRPNNDSACILISPYCTNRCLFCKPEIQNRLPDAMVRKQEVNAYRNILNFKKQGYRRIEISGSDPMEYDRIAELIGYLKGVGFEMVQLSTNALGLAEPEMLERIVESGLDRIRVPIYGSNASIHDSVTQNRGSFKKTVNGVKGLIEKNPLIEVQFSSLVIKQNKHDLIPIFNLMSSLGGQNNYFSIPLITGNEGQFYIPTKDLKPHVSELHKYAIDNGYPIHFTEIPYCVFEFYSDNVSNDTRVPELGRYGQPAEEFRSGIPNLPSYRLKTKILMCRNCIADKNCSGFLVSDIRKYGVGDLRPIIKEGEGHA